MTTPDWQFRIRAELFPLEAVYGACYVFIDRAYVHLDAEGGELVVRLKRKPGASEAAWEQVEGEFRNELLHQALRHKLSVQHMRLREYVVTQALFSAQPARPARPPKAAKPARRPRAAAGRR